MVGRRGPLDDLVDMASSGYQNMPGHDVSGVANASFVQEGLVEEVDHVVQEDTASASSDTDEYMCSCNLRCINLKFRQEYVTVTILVVINLLNYMDRFTIPAVQTPLKEYYHIDNGPFGAVQTTFVCSYMIFSPIFGYLGDRYNRKILMAIGIFVWTITTAASSFVPSEYFWLFLLARALIGIGEASYSTVAPTIFADLFQRDTRTKVLAVFYFAIPVGSGLGYIVGSQALALGGKWQWALRITPMLGAVLFILILALVKDPPRGRSEGSERLQATSYWADLRYLFRNKSYMFTALGFTCVSFVTGALAWWAPGFLYSAWNFQANSVAASLSTISLGFGAVTMVAGISGVLIGSETARRWRARVPHVDGLICAVGLLASTPFIFFALIVSQYNVYVTFVLVLIGETLICLNWSLVVDVMLAVVIPTRQATASGVQNLIAHSLGDAGSPWLVGAISDAIRLNGPDPKSLAAKYFSLQYALFTTTFMAAIGGGFFLLLAMAYPRDRARYRRMIEASHRNIDFNEEEVLADGEVPVTPLDTRNLIT